MRPDVPLPTGLKPTIRHLMIVVIWAALMLAVVRLAPGLQGPGVAPEMAFMLVAISVGFWPMALLVSLLTILDRRGPVRGWYVSCCSVVGSFVNVAGMLLIDPVSFALSGRATPAFPMFPFCALVCLFAGVMQLRLIWPRRCLRCEGRGIIPTGRLIRCRPPHETATFHGWCSRCGADYERESSKPWATLEDAEKSVVIRTGFFRTLKTIRNLERRRIGDKIE